MLQVFSCVTSNRNLVWIKSVHCAVGAYAMVSIVLLTTEEVLESNRFWCRLDSDWITEDLEPFEDVKVEDIYEKPLTRDSYYAKFPDIVRSESEDETPMTIAGFQQKYCEWRTKIFLKKICENRRNSIQFYKRQSVNDSSNPPKTRRHSSVIENSSRAPASQLEGSKNDERVRDFFHRLLKSVPPPPPIEELSSSIVEAPKDKNFSDIVIPEDYAAFEEDTITQNEHFKPTSSTLKRSRKRSSYTKRRSFVEFEHRESWYETIYGVSDLILNSDISISYDKSDVTIVQVKQDDPNNNSESHKNLNISNEYYESWSEDVISPFYLCIDEITTAEEEIVSQSGGNDSIADISLTDDETAYARFAVYKIYQTLKIESGIADSSSLVDFYMSIEEYDGIDDQCKRVNENASYVETVYRLVPDDNGDDDDLVNEYFC